MGCNRSKIGRDRFGSLMAALATMALVSSGNPAHAENFFDALFGGVHQPAPLPTSAFAYAAPGRDRDVIGPAERAGPAEHPEVRSVAFCVRLCDGRYFPIEHHQAATPIVLCKAMCPASRTRIYTGSEIDHATASNGTRYADLDNAFVYRQRLVPGCTCNGKDVFGLAPVEPTKDPTLRPGDMVATATGLMAYTPTKSRHGESKAASFTPVDRDSALSRGIQARLATLSPNQ